MTQSKKPGFFKQIADNIAWTWAIIFPKKAKPSKVAQAAAISPAANPSTAKASQPAMKTSSQTSAPDLEKRERRLRTFWTWGSALSIGLNVILLLVIIVLANQLFVIKQLVGDQLLGGLYVNFVKMDQAHITKEIKVNDQIPIDFSLTISQDTVVTLTENTSIPNATVVSLNTGGLVIRNAPANITLPVGTTLPVHLELTVPVKTIVPVSLKVPVDIALNETQLHEPFTGLQNVIAPYYWLLKPEWNNCQKVPVLGALGSGCNLFFSAPSK